MRGRLNTAKRLAWVKKNYPEEVYIRTALIALDPDQHAESEKKGRELMEVALSAWGQYAPEDEGELADLSFSEFFIGEFPERVHRFIERVAPPNMRPTPIDSLIPWIAQQINRDRKELKKARAARRGQPRSTVNSFEAMRAKRLRALTSLWRWQGDLLDWVAAERPNLSRIPLAEAIGRTRVWHEEMEERMEQIARRQSVRDAGKVVRRWRDGWTMREIGTRPDDLRVNIKELQAVGAALKHCYGNPGTARRYADEMGERAVRKRIYVLFDPKGDPHVAVDLRIGREDQRRGDVHKRWKNRPKLPVASDTPIYANDIIQVRGKSNRVPKERYRKKTLQFLAKLMDWKLNKLPAYGTELDEAGFLLEPQDQLQWFLNMGADGADMLETLEHITEGEVAWLPTEDLSHWFEWVNRVNDISYAADYYDDRRSPQQQVEGDVQIEYALPRGMPRGRLPSSAGDLRGAKLALTYNLDGYFEEMEKYDWEPFWSQVYSTEQMAEKLGTDDEAFFNDLHFAALDEAHDKALKRTFWDDPSYVSVHPKGHQTAEWGAGGLFLVDLGSTSHELLGVPGRDPLEELLLHLRDSERSYGEILASEYADSLEGLIDKARKPASANRVARKRRSRHHRGAPKIRSNARPTRRRRRSPTGVSRWH